MSEAELDAGFYEAIGRALTAWSGVEACFTSLFQACYDAVLANSDSLARSGFSGKVLDAVDGVSARVKMVHEALSGTLINSNLDQENSVIAKQLFEQWDKLRKTVLSDLVPRRNKLAHWSVYDTWDTERNCRRPILLPHVNSFRRHEYLRDGSFMYDEAYVRECRIIFDNTRASLQTLALGVTQNNFGMVAQLDNMRSALHYWGSGVDAICDHLRVPYEPTASI